MKLILQLILITTLLPLICPARFTSSLSSWTFTLQNEKRQFVAKIPSTLSLDLIDNGIISDDPYYRDNFLKFYDYETKDASYKTQFAIPSQLINSQYQYLVFQGLDTHAEVYLNGEHILSAHNMFRRFEVKVNFKLNNILVVNFTSSVKYDLAKQKEFKQTNGFSLPQNYSFTRKAAYQYGWDWGPRVLTIGIWKQVKVLLYNDSKIQDLRFTHSTIGKNVSSIDCQVTANVKDLDSKAVYKVQLKAFRLPYNLTIFKQSSEIKATEQSLAKFDFKITQNPINYIWWTWDLGNPNLIRIQLILKNLNTSQQINSTIKTGIRTISVIQQDKSFPGTSFTFNLNGYDVYMRGGNYIPPEMSLARTNKQTYQKIKQYALFARYNMIRLWGGGQFQKDQFYQTMDEAGILIWHDLMFACALYPSSEEILANIEQEMRDNVKRIRHHPSLGLWNGNNQVWIGWQEWGWQTGLSQGQRQLVERMYNAIFKQTLAKVLQQEHPQVYYWQTSPSSSSNSVSSIGSGDIHFWRVWGGGTPIEQYEMFVGRFNSQYGMQSMPEISSILKFTQPSDWTINSYILRLHQRHPYGDRYLPGYTFNYSGSTQNLTRYSYFSQVMQSYALEMGITSLRLNKPYNMGSLYWQLNDVWPVSSWATVDYYGTYKAAHYRIRQVHQQLMIHTLHDTKTGDYVTYIVNQYPETYFCYCVLTLQLNTGEAKLNFTIQRTVGPFQRVLVRRFSSAQIAPYKQTGFIKARMTTTSNVVSSNNFFFVPMKNRQNLVPQLTYQFKGQSIMITAYRLASYIWIYRKKGSTYLPLKLQDNYFTLAANQSKIVFIGDVPQSEIFVTCYQIQFNADKTNLIREMQQQ